MLKEFKEFAIKGNAIDLAVGVIIGSAFGKIVDSLVKDIILPPFGLLLGNIDFSALKISFSSGATLNYGSFLNTVISFLIIAFSIFIVIKQLARFQTKKQEPPTNKECPFCKSRIPVAATKCAHCTADLG